MKQEIQSLLDYRFFKIGNFIFDVSDIVKLFVIFLLAKTLLFLVSGYFRRRIKRGKIDVGSAYAIRQIVSYILWIFAILLALQSIGLNISILLAGSAALLVGIGLGIQQTFNDFFSGIILLMEGSIKVDDVLEFDDMVCKVQKIGIRTSQVITRDQISVIVPNSKFTGDKVINWTHSQHASRFHVKIGVDYKSDIHLVSSLLLEAVKEHAMISGNPEPFVRLEGFGDSSIDFGVYFWTENVFVVENIKSEIRFSIIEKFRRAGISIPFPQRDIHITGNEFVK
jgi:small-conductance mechanosensitive channel